MTKQTFALIFITLLALNMQAQNTRSTDQVSRALENLDVFRNYKQFRTNFETTTTDAGKNLKYYDDYVRLNVAYNAIQEQYNNLLHDIKADLSDWKTIQRMVKSPKDFADRYLEEYNAVIGAYNTNFKPIYNDVNARSLSSGGKALPPILAAVGLELFIQVVDLIKSRNEDKDLAMNSILGTINQHFVQKLEMKSWSELNIAQPTLVNPNQSTAGTPNKWQQQSNAAGTTNRTTTENVDVPKPLFERLNGWLEFNYMNTASQPERMGFAHNSGGKDLTVQVLRPQNGQVIADAVPVNVGFYNSTQTFPEGTQFQIKAFNTAGMYVFALNSGNRVEMLYPFRNDSFVNCSEKIGNGKDLTVLPATFVVGQDRNKVTTLPAPDCSTTPPTERYITITGAGTRETLCVVLSRSELDTSTLAKEIEAATGELPERLAKVFGDKMIGLNEAQLALTDNRMAFNADNSAKNVLPVVFYINRK